MESTIRIVAWPAPVRRAVDAIATLFMCAYQTARTRALDGPAPMVRALAMRDDEAHDAALLGRENAVLRRRLESIPDPRLRIVEIELTGYAKRVA